MPLAFPAYPANLSKIMIKEALVKKFIADAKAEVQKELLQELGDLITEKYSELEEEISQLKEKLEAVKPVEGWL